MQSVIITGASKGIGLATTQKFLSEGYRVLGTSRTGEILLENKNLIKIKLDLADSDSIEQAITKISKHSPINILINNAGVKLEPEENKMDINLLRQTVEINLIGLIDFTEKIIPFMDDSGHIVNFSSKRGSLSYDGSGTCPAYRISKTAVNMYTRTLAKRLENRKITVSSFDPGWVKTDLGGREAIRNPDIPAQELYGLVHSHIDSGYFWYAGQKAAW